MSGRPKNEGTFTSTCKQNLETRLLPIDGALGKESGFFTQARSIYRDKDTITHFVYTGAGRGGFGSTGVQV